MFTIENAHLVSGGRAEGGCIPPHLDKLINR